MKEVKKERYQNTQNGKVFDVTRITLTTVHMVDAQTKNKIILQYDGFLRAVEHGVLVLENEAPQNFVYVIMKKEYDTEGNEFDYSGEDTTPIEAHRTFSEAQKKLNKIENHRNLFASFHIRTVRLF